MLPYGEKCWADALNKEYYRKGTERCKGVTILEWDVSDSWCPNRRFSWSIVLFPIISNSLHRSESMCRKYAKDIMETSTRKIPFRRKGLKHFSFKNFMGGNRESWSAQLLPRAQSWLGRDHVEIDNRYYLIQVFSGHGLLFSILFMWNEKTWKPNMSVLRYCRDDAKYMLFICDNWS